MKELKLKSSEICSLTDLINIEESQLISDTYHTLLTNFQQILNYNKKLIKNNNFDEVIFKEFKKFYKISAESKSQINKHILKYSTDNIIYIYIDSKFRIIKEVKILLSNIYNEFYKNYLHDIVDNASLIKSVKIYDFYKNKEDLNLTIENLTKDDKRQNFIKSIISNNKNSKQCNIQILTHLNTEKSFDFYQNLYEYDNNISIKYIPESASENIYIPSLFFMLIKYRVKETKNYKDVVLYLEPSTNWGVVSDAYSVGFTSQFVELLNIRFNEQFKSNYQLTFQPNKLKQTEDNFIEDIVYILKMIDEELLETNTKINKDILESIHKLKTNYKTINYSYKLLKSFFYNILYLHSIKNYTKKEPLMHTQSIINILIEKRYIKTIDEIIIDITKNHIGKKIITYDVDIKKLRRGVIEEINNKKAICDIFPNMSWIHKDDIINSLTSIALNEKYLTSLYEELNLNSKKPFLQKRENFEKILIPNLTKGLMVTLH